jgi:hypothetical protein
MRVTQESRVVWRIVDHQSSCLSLISGGVEIFIAEGMGTQENARITLLEFLPTFCAYRAFKPFVPFT